MIPLEGSMAKPRPGEFEEFLLELCVGEYRGVSKARVTSLHFPSVHYFAIFIERCLTAKQDSSMLSAPDLSILHSALYGDRTHSLGAIVARRLCKNRTKGIIYGGVYATRLAAHFNVPIRHEEDYKLPASYLDFASMKRHVFIEEYAAPNAYRYNLVFSQVSREIITLPAPALFDRQARGRYFIMPDDITDYKNGLEMAHDEEVHPWEAQVPQPGPYDYHYLSGPTGFDPW